MLKVKLINHKLRYEVFHIISLFYNKSEFNFIENEDECDLQSGFDSINSKVYCRINRFNDKPIFYSEIIAVGDKKQFKSKIKLTLLKCLKELTGKNIPWGILVGIRPTKIVHESLKEGHSRENVIQMLTKDYDMDIDKAELTWEIAGNEAKFIESGKKDISLYLGIPFCPTRCSYCSFTSNSITGRGDLVNNYLDSLLYEAEAMITYLKANEYNIDTVYIGGGTPTSLNLFQLERILDAMDKLINLKTLREFTIEAGRPDSIDKDKLNIIRESGCKRISINPQTMNDETLKSIGRMHTSKDVIHKYYMARELGFDNINMDMIIGLPGEKERQIYNTINVLERLRPDNITVHTMAIKRASILSEQNYEVDHNMVKNMYDIAGKAIRDMDMYPYYMYRQKNMVSPLENIGYCKRDKECIYNIQMISESISIVALGADAVSKIIFRDENRIERAANVQDVREYNARVDEMIASKIKLFETL